MHGPTNPKDRQCTCNIEVRLCNRFCIGWFVWLSVLFFIVMYVNISSWLKFIQPFNHKIMTLKIKTISIFTVRTFSLICEWEGQVTPVSHYQLHHFYTKLPEHSRVCWEFLRIFVLILILGATPLISEPAKFVGRLYYSSI